MKNAFIIGGSGQIGLSVGERLAREGFEVTLASRDAPPAAGPWRHVSVDREDDAALGEAIGEGVDLLMDCVAFEKRHGEQLARLSDNVGRIVFVSSASVYCDAAGGTLDEAGENGFPHFPVPIGEDHRTVEPGEATYSTKKAAIERILLEDAAAPVTVLRPCAIHGAWSKHAREWWFVKRLLDGRRCIPLAYGGRSRFQTTSTAAIGDAVIHGCETSGSHIVNVTDADSPSVMEIGHAIMAAMGRDAELVPLPDPAEYPPEDGRTPWSVERPMICASSLANDVPYAKAVKPAVAWLIEAVGGRDWREFVPVLARYPTPQFDYEAEDRLLARL